MIVPGKPLYRRKDAEYARRIGVSPQVYHTQRARGLRWCSYGRHWADEADHDLKADCARHRKQRRRDAADRSKGRPCAADCWIQTATGGVLHPLRPRPEEIKLEDIAISLANTNRFCGATRAPYSVAQHSLLVASVMPIDRPDLRLWALLHDAAEYAFGDVLAPMLSFFPRYHDASQDLLQTVIEKFGLSWPIPPEVEQADLRMLVTERRDLLAEPPISWGDAIEATEPYGFEIVPSQAARDTFLGALRAGLR